MDTDFRKKMEERNERFEQLYNKPVNELVRMIVSLEEENERLKDYRTKLIKIRNIITPEEERRKQGRPKKGEEVI
jgi:hypothetical protein